MTVQANNWRTWLARAGMVLAILAGSAPAVAAPAAAAPAPAANPANTSPAATDRTIAEGLFTTSRALTGPKVPRECGQQDTTGAIVVCGADHGEQWRVPSTTDSDPTSRAAQDTGIARAPNVNSLPGCSRGCIGIGKKGPPPVLVVDFSKLPEAPPGSDADKIAKGEMREP